MSLIAYGLNHKTAPLQLREQVVFPEHELLQSLQDLSRQNSLQEVAILSTCNRTEIYCDVNASENNIIAWLARQRHLEQQVLAPCIYKFRGQNAIQHMMRVASGLDSMVLGEPQIFGQMKSAYQYAETANLIGTNLRPVFQQVFATSKKVRTQTTLGCNSLSIGQIAVNMSKKLFTHLNQLTVLLIGSGEMIELAAQHFFAQGVKQILITNRTLEKAATLAKQVQGHAVSINELALHLSKADIVISATSCPLPIISKNLLQSVFEKRSQSTIFMLDLAVPRDIEADVADLKNVHLYNIDNLQTIINNNLEERKQAAAQAEIIIATELQHYLHHQDSLVAVDTIRSVRQQVDALRDDELAQALQQLAAGADAQTVMSHFAHSLTQKLLHAPTIQLRKAGEAQNKELLTAARQLFSLDEL